MEGNSVQNRVHIAPPVMSSGSDIRLILCIFFLSNSDYLRITIYKFILAVVD